MKLQELLEFDNTDGSQSPLSYGGTPEWRQEKDFFKKWFSRPYLTGGYADQKVEEDSTMTVTDEMIKDKVKRALKKYDIQFDELKPALLKGTKVELEHTDDYLISLNIALDHILEFLDYYDQIEKIEGDTNINEVDIQKVDFDPKRISYVFNTLQNISNFDNFKGYKVKSGEVDGLLLVGIDDVGYIIIAEEDNFYILKNSYINPDYRGKNIRNILIEFALSHLHIKPIVSNNTVSPMSLKSWNKLKSDTNLKLSLFDFNSKEIVDSSNVLGDNIRFLIDLNESILEEINPKRYKNHPPKKIREQFIDGLIKKIGLKENLHFNLTDNFYKILSSKILNNAPLVESISNKSGKLYLLYESKPKFLKSKPKVNVIEANNKNVNQLLRNANSYSVIGLFRCNENDLPKLLTFLTLKEEGKIVKGVNTTVDVGVDEIKKQAKKFGNAVKTDGTPKYSFRDSIRMAGKVTQENRKIQHILKEGGNAFKNPQIADQMRRIKREEIPATIDYVSKITGLSKDYISNNLMGSAGKQADSGDLDIAMDREEFGSDILKKIADKVRQNVGKDQVSTTTMKGGQIQTALPIEGDPEKGLIQVDFILGDPEWLKFSHWSPGEDRSKYKGVFISTALGVLAKMKKVWEYKDPETGERKARLGWAFDLENGLFLRPEAQKKPGQGLSKMDPEQWETWVWTKFGVKPPRIPRLGYIRNPDDVVKILFGEDTERQHIETLEDLVEVVRKNMPNRFDEFTSRLKDALKRSSAIKDKEKIDNLSFDN